MQHHCFNPLANLRLSTLWTALGAVTMLGASAFANASDDGPLPDLEQAIFVAQQVSTNRAELTVTYTDIGGAIAESSHLVSVSGSRSAGNRLVQLSRVDDACRTLAEQTGVYSATGFCDQLSLQTIGEHVWVTYESLDANKRLHFPLRIARDGQRASMTDATASLQVSLGAATIDGNRLSTATISGEHATAARGVLDPRLTATLGLDPIEAALPALAEGLHRFVAHAFEEHDLARASGRESVMPYGALGGGDIIDGECFLFFCQVPPGYGEGPGGGGGTGPTPDCSNPETMDPVTCRPDFVILNWPVSLRSKIWQSGNRPRRSMNYRLYVMNDGDVDFASPVGGFFQDFHSYLWVSPAAKWAQGAPLYPFSESNFFDGTGAVDSWGVDASDLAVSCDPCVPQIVLPREVPVKFEGLLANTREDVWPEGKYRLYAKVNPDLFVLEKSSGTSNNVDLSTIFNFVKIDRGE